MTDEQMMATAIENYNNLTKFEKKFLSGWTKWQDRKALSIIKRIEEDEHHPYHRGVSGDYYYAVDTLWRSCLGESFQPNIERAKEQIKDLPRVKKAFDAVKRAVRWPSFDRNGMDEIIENNQLTPFILFYAIERMGTESKYVFDSYMANHHFEVGHMVQFRANIGTDALLKCEQYGGGNFWYGCTARDLEKAKEKIFMIIEIDPTFKGTKYAKNYSYNPKQGGSRLYKVLPIGEAKTYLVVEKFLKKVRVKGKKNAKKK
jgi:hypothetical protein